MRPAVLVLPAACFLGYLSGGAAEGIAHAGMMKIPEFDEIVVAHLPTQIGEDFNPYQGRLMPDDHEFRKPIYAPTNEKLFKKNIAETITDSSSDFKVHAGNWYNGAPEEVPDLDLGPIGYSRQWLGEDKMGGGWSSQANPLSGDMRGMENEATGQLRQMGLTDEEDPDYEWRTDAEGVRHKMPRKK